MPTTLADTRPFLNFIYIFVVDQSTDAPGWPTLSLGPDNTAMRIDTPPIALPKEVTSTAAAKSTPETSLGLYHISRSVLLKHTCTPLISTVNLADRHKVVTWL